MRISINTIEETILSNVDYSETEDINTVICINNLLLCIKVFYAEKDYYPTWDELIDWYKNKHSSIKTVIEDWTTPKKEEN